MFVTLGMKDVFGVQNIVMILVCARYRFSVKVGNVIAKINDSHRRTSRMNIPCKNCEKFGRPYTVQHFS